MKNINMKKIVAGAGVFAVSALFAGAVAAANVAGPDYTSVDNLTKAQLFGATGPAYNVIVGSMAQPVDVVWAGNIAAAIGKKAYTSGDAIAGATFNSVTVTAGAESTSTVSGDGLLADTFTVNAAESSKTLDYQDYSVLYQEDKDVDSDHAGASTLTVYDELYVNSKVYFNTDKDVKDLVASVDKGDIIYSVDLDEGIKNDYTNSGASPKLKFNLMGQEYTVDSYDGTTLSLIQNIATQTYDVGATLEVEDYTLEIVKVREGSNGTTTIYEATINLLDAEGAVVSSDTFAGGDTKIFDSYLDATVDIDTVYSDGVKLITGTSGKLELKDSTKISDFPNKDDKLWMSTFTTSGNYLTGFSIKTDDSDLRFTNDDALQVGDSIELPLGLGSIEFLGLTSEASTSLEIKDNYITYTDASRKEHEVPLYDLDEASTARDTYTTPEIDGKPLYVKFYSSTSTDDANFTIQLDDSEGKYLTNGTVGSTDATWVSNTPEYYTSADANIGSDANFGTYYDLEIPLFNNNDILVDYTLLVQPNAVDDYNTVKSVAFGLTKTQSDVFDLGDTTYDLDVSQIDGDGTNASSHADEGRMIGGSDGTTSFNVAVARDEFESIAQIKVYNGTDTAIYSYIDAYTGDIVDVSDNTFTDTYKQMAYTDGTNTFNLSNEGNDTDLEFGYTTYGALVSIEDGYPMFTLPEKQLKGQLFVGGGASTSTSINGSTFTLTAEGEQQTEDGVSVSLDAVALSGGAATDAIVPMTWNVATNKLVYLDNENPAGNKIIVGGHLVNTLAQNIGLDTMLTASGDYVLGQNAEGNIVVAGMTAEDTAMAAKELINVIENM
ncbi:MAG: hypothetical protein PHR26_01570 [Candidatus ainarchaeum sp.]|nr:hypothetical protein [Candidatus ainarchaeum sp.]